MLAVAKSKKPTLISYGPFAFDQDGAMYSAQSAAGRSSKSTVIVRYESLDAPGEIVLEHNAKVHGLWVSPKGSCHAVSQDGNYHLGKGGTWTKQKLSKRALVAISGLDDDFLLASGNGPSLFVSGGGPWSEAATGLDRKDIDFFGSIDARLGPEDVYVAGTGGVAHSCAGTWTAVAHESGPKSVAAVSRDEVYIASATGLFRGNARVGFVRVVERRLQYIAIYRDAIYVCAYSGGVFRLHGNALELVSAPDLSVSSLATSGAWLCAKAGMGTSIYLFDGNTWLEKKPS